MNWSAFVILALGGITLTIGDLFMKKWTVSNTWYVFAGGLLVWLVGLIFLAASFKYKNIAVASVIFILFNVLSLGIVSWFYFKEKLSGLAICGMLLGLFAIIFLELADK